MSNKIVISKAGFNAVTTTTPDNLIFSSEFNTLKYATAGVYVMTTNTTTVATIAHGLGYNPFYAAYVNLFDAAGDGTGQFGLVEFLNLNAPLRAARAYVDSNNLYLSYNAGAVPTYTLLWYFKIFRNKLEI